MPRGTVLVEHQQAGIRVASRVLSLIREEDDLQFARDVIAPSGMNTAWYGFARDASVMRRRLKLPFLVMPEGVEPRDRFAVFEDATEAFERSTVMAGSVVRAVAERLSTLNECKINLGRLVGNASLVLVCSEIGEQNHIAPFVTQARVRQQGLIALNKARALEAEIGSPPSLAQLADPDSDLSVYIRRTAPDGVYQAFDQAIAFEALATFETQYQ